MKIPFFIFKKMSFSSAMISHTLIMPSFLNWSIIEAVLYENILNEFLTCLLDFKYDRTTQEMKKEKHRHPPSVFFVVNGSFCLCFFLQKNGFIELFSLYVLVSDVFAHCIEFLQKTDSVDWSHKFVKYTFCRRYAFNFVYIDSDIWHQKYIHCSIFVMHVNVNVKNTTFWRSPTIELCN